jgi:hypothetical protein
MSKKFKNQMKSKFAAEKPLGKMLDILYRARVEASLDKIASLKAQIVHVFARARYGDLSSSTARTLSLDLEQELTRTICSLESWHLEMRSRL